MKISTEFNNAQAKVASMITVAVNDLMRKKDGLTTVEYAVAGALIAAAVVVAFGTLGNTVGDVIDNIEGAIGG